MKKEFQWTDELVQEYVAAIMTSNHPYFYKMEHWKKYKADTQPKEQSKPEKGKDWEIVSVFDPNRGVIKVGSDSVFNYVEGEPIHSVRRNSDGQVFSVGDDTNKGVIKNFSIGVDDKLLYIIAGNNSWKLSELQKSKPIEKERITVSIFGDNMAGGQLMVRPNSGEWKLSKEKFSEIKQAIEQVLNDEVPDMPGKWYKTHIKNLEGQLDVSNKIFSLIEMNTEKELEDAFNAAREVVSVYDHSHRYPTFEDYVKSKIK